MITDFVCVIDTLANVGQTDFTILSERSSTTGVTTLVVATDGASTELTWPLPTVDLVVGRPGNAPGTVEVVPCYDWRPDVPESAVEGLLSIPADQRVAFRCRPSGEWAHVAFERWMTGSMPAILADIRRPLLVDLSGPGIAPYPGVFDLCSSHPTLPVVLEVGGRGDMSVVRHLTRACPNLLVATVGLDSDCLSEIIEDLGAGRIVFGSGHPEWTQEAAVRTIDRLSLGPAERELVMSENARRLLAGEWKPS